MEDWWGDLLRQAQRIGWWHLALLPVWAAFIGWGTTWLAIKMIFRPRRPIHILGFRVQGLMHKRHRELAASIGHTVERHLISHQDVLAIMQRPETMDTIGATINERVAIFLDQKLARLHPMVGMVLGGAMKEKLQRVLAEEIESVLPEFSAQMMDRLERELDFQRIVTEKINAFEMDRLERIIYDIARQELRAIELLCGVLGFVVGLLQAAFMLIG